MASPIEVVGMAEAAEIVGITKSNFSAHRAKNSGEDECPAPTAQLVCGPVWAGSDVAKLRKWAKKFGASRVVRAPSVAASVPEPSAAPAKAAKVAKKVAAPVTKAGPDKAAVNKKKGLFGK